LLRLFFKSQSALMPLLLLSKSNPLRWASIWFGRVLWSTVSKVLGYHTSSRTSFCLRRFFIFRSALHAALVVF